MDNSNKVYVDRYYNEVRLEVPYADILFFDFEHGYTNAWYFKDGVLTPLLMRNTLVTLKIDHPELVWIRRGILAKPSVLINVVKHKGLMRSSYTVGIKGTDLRLLVSKQKVVKIHSVMGAKLHQRADNRIPDAYLLKKKASHERAEV